MRDALNENLNINENNKNILESNFNDSGYLHDNMNNNQTRFTELNSNFEDNPLGFTEIKDSRQPSISSNNNPNIKNTNNNNTNISNNNNQTNQHLKKGSYIKNGNNNINKKAFKIILVGESSVGKTSIMKRFIENKFNNEYQSTIAAVNTKKLYRIDNDNIAELNIWDTAGEEKFRTITKQFYKDAHGALLIYDITQKETFAKIDSWLDEIIDTAPSDIVIFLIGNKIDMDQKREVEYNDGKNFAEENSILFYEVSAKNGNNVGSTFDILANKIFQTMKEEENNENKYMRREQRSSIQLNKNTFNEKKNCPNNICC